MPSERDIINTLIAEALGEGQEGMRMVAETILNRSAIRGITPAQVVRQPAQYTGYSSPGPAARAAQNNPQAISAAQAAWEMAQGRDDPTGGADHYFAPGTISTPYWARSMQPTVQSGGHSFYSSRPVPQIAKSAPVPVSQSASMAVNRSNTSPSGGNTALQSALTAYATREGNRVTPMTMQGKATTVASFPTTQSLTSPGAVNASVGLTRQDPAPQAMSAIAQLQAQGLSAAQAYSALSSSNNPRNNPDAASRVNGKSGLSSMGGGYYDTI